MSNVNPEVNMNRFLAIKDKARKIMQMDRSGELDKIRDNAARSGKLSMNEGIEPVAEMPMNAYPQTPQMSQMPQYIPQTQPMGMGSSKLPSAILESFKNKQIDTSVMGLSTTGSVLDRINFNTQGALFEQTQPKQEVKEVKVVTEQTQPTVSTSVDYSMIKMIVEDCMRKYSSALKKTIINESKTTSNEGTLKAMKVGDKFSFITDNGDLYEAKLTFIKNINKK
jgi:hypothetical protein